MKRFFRSGILVSCLLVACLVSFPAWASGAGGGVGFSLRVHGGFSYLMAADVNTGSQGWFDYYQLVAEEQGLTTGGGYSSMHGGYDFGADLIFELSPHIGLGLGVGYLQSSRTSVMTITSTDLTVTMRGTPKLSALPIRLGLFTTWPLGQKLNFTANAGAAYYAAVKFRAHLRLEDDIDEDWLEQSITAGMNRLSNIGFQGGLGLEYRLSERMFLFVEAQGRYAKFKNFETATGFIDSSFMEPDETDGKIYLETNTSSDFPVGTWTWFIVSETVPMPDPEAEYREPKFDFSGFSLQGGFRIRF